MRHYALTGYPLGHSVSPEIHRRLFSLSGSPEDSYTLLPIPPETFAERFSELRSLDGFNLTIPHKQAVLPFLDRLDRSAERYRSVNVVANRNGTLTGYNTDVCGFLKSLESLGASLSGKHVLILGYGGAGRMMATESVLQGASEIRIAARRTGVPKALSLAREIQGFGRSCRISVCSLEEVSGNYDLILNSTPCGMYPDTDSSPLSAGQFNGSAFLFDAIYNPGETKLMREARKNGIRTAGGMTMLVWQAAEAHRIWYGASFGDREIEALILEMEHRVSAVFPKKELSI